MRTKPCQGVPRVDVTSWEPRPEVGMLYDGLAGLSNRSILRDVAEELARQEQLPAFLRPLQKSGSAQVHITFYDYVSYGVGGGDASSEFWYGSFLVLWVDATHPFRGGGANDPRPRLGRAIEHSRPRTRRARRPASSSPGSSGLGPNRSHVTGRRRRSSCRPARKPA